MLRIVPGNENAEDSTASNPYGSRSRLLRFASLFDTSLNDTEPVSIPLRRISVVIPCYNAGDTVQRTLNSLCFKHGFDLEVVLADDGSDPPLDASLLRWFGKRPLHIVRSETNVGKAAACNLAFAQTTGEAVIVLDADDQVTPNWGETLCDLLAAWTAHSPLAFAHTITEWGVATGSGGGLYTREEWLKGIGRGEYLPIFRGEIARTKGYIVCGCRKICGTLSYARILQDGPLYVHPALMRVYFTRTAGSLSKNPFRTAQALDSYRCFHAARQAIEAHDRANGKPSAPYLNVLYFREAFYYALGQNRLGGFQFAWQHRRNIGKSRLLVMLALLAVPTKMLALALALAKRRGIFPRFG